MKLQGIGAAPWLAVGPAVVWQDEQLPPGTRATGDAKVELARLAAATQASTWKRTTALASAPSPGSPRSQWAC